MAGPRVLRALSLWRPWAASIVHGPKRVENRSWPVPSTVRPAMHAGALWLALAGGDKFDGEGAEFVAERWDEARVDLRAQPLPFSDVKAWPAVYVAKGVVGVARVVRCYRIEDATHPGGTVELAPKPTPWSFGPWCWELADVHALPEPIPLRGFQGLFRLPLDLERRLAPLCVTA